MSVFEARSSWTFSTGSAPLIRNVHRKRRKPTGRERDEDHHRRRHAALRPNVLLSNRAIVPPSYRHHTCAVAEFPNDAGPLSGPELDRVRRDLRRRTATILFDVRLMASMCSLIPWVWG